MDKIEDTKYHVYIEENLEATLSVVPLLYRIKKMDHFADLYIIISS